jgi:hypothetical protein
MDSLSFSLCCYVTFRIVQVLNTIRWTILWNKMWHSYYTSGAKRVCNPVVPHFISETGIIWTQLILWWFQTPTDCCYTRIYGCCCYLLILIRSTVGQIINVRGHCIEVWCVSCATGDQYCIKASVEFWQRIFCLFTF